MIKGYRIFTLVFCFVVSICVAFDIRDLVSGFTSLDNIEDFSILLFIIIALYFSITFSLETGKRFKKKVNRYEKIDAEQIRRSLKSKGFNRVNLYGNLMVGILIVLGMGAVLLSSPLEEFLDDYFRLISIGIIVIYGLIQIHFSLLVKKKLEEMNS